MDEFISTGIIERPLDTSILQILFVNNCNQLKFQTLYFYQWTNDVQTLLETRNYFIQPNGRTLAEFPLVLNFYDEKRDVLFYEVVYGPTDPCLNITFSNI